MNIQAYEKDRDRDAVLRIWKEVGWLQPADAAGLTSTEYMIEASRCWVAHIHDAAETAVTCTSGAFRYLDESLPFSGVTSVVTGRAGRKQGTAAATTAHAVAHEVENGAILCGLSMFEQGFYDRLGFGSCGYEIRSSFDPARLKVEPARRPAKRITLEDWERVHQSRLGRAKRHGSVDFFPAKMTHSNMLDLPNCFGLGYFDGPDGELTHHVWFSIEDEENGPYWVRWMTYQTPAQLLELIGLVKNLGDQVHLVTLLEPADIQFQDLVRQPISHRATTANTKFAAGTKALAVSQMRICDMPACLAKTRLECAPFKFNAVLTDPIASLLDPNHSWKGVAGEYIVTLGSESAAEAGTDPALPTLNASVNAFTRMWIGVRPAGGLAITDDLSAPPELIEKLERALRLPDCRPDWDY